MSTSQSARRRPAPARGPTRCRAGTWWSAAGAALVAEVDPGAAAQQVGSDWAWLRAIWSWSMTSTADSDWSTVTAGRVAVTVIRSRAVALLPRCSGACASAHAGRTSASAVAVVRNCIGFSPARTPARSDGGSRDGGGRVRDGPRNDTAPPPQCPPHGEPVEGLWTPARGRSPDWRVEPAAQVLAAGDAFPCRPCAPVGAGQSSHCGAMSRA